MASGQRQILEAKLARVELAIGELEQERIQLKREINECCLISKIPPEILGKVFTDTFPQNSFAIWGQSSPLLFGAVCSSWRDIAWSSPTLWSSISFTIENYTRTKNDILREWVARSGNLPLSIMFNMRKPSKTLKKKRIMKPIILESMEIITCCSSRWQDINFYLFTEFNPDFRFIPADLPLLVSMSIILRGSSDFQTIKSWSFNAPKLQCAHHNIHRLDLPLKQMKTFSWSSPYYFNTRLGIFREAPNLTNLKVRFPDMLTHYAQPMSVDSTSTTLQIKTLEVTSYLEYGIPKELFNSLTVPALHELSVGITCPDMDFKPYTVFISLISRSGCHLTRLSLFQLLLSAEQFAEWFSVVPSLVELHIEKTAVINEIFRDLTLDKVSRRTLLPNLENLTYVHYIRDDIDFCALAHMVVSRWGRDSQVSPLLEVAQLKTVHVEFSYIFDKHLRYRNQRLDVDDLDNEEKEEREGEEKEKYYAKHGRETSKLEISSYTIAGFQGLIAEGMDIRVPGMENWPV